MNFRLAEGWRVWIASVLVSGAALCAGVSLFKVPVTSPTNLSNTIEFTAGVSVELASRQNLLLNDEVALRDPTPLFLPSRWNAAEDALAMNAPREPGGALQDYPPKLAFAAEELKLDLPPVISVPKRPAEAFGLANLGQPYVGFGQTDETVEALPARKGYIEVVSAADGTVQFNQALNLEGPPSGVLWQPLEFLLAVDAAGLVRLPVLTESSRVTSVDSYFQNYLVNILRIGERLSPGFYRISIGP